MKEVCELILHQGNLELHMAILGALSSISMFQQSPCYEIPSGL